MGLAANQIRAQLLDARKRLSHANIDNPALAARLLLQEVLKLDHGQLILQEMRFLSDEEAERFDKMLRRRIKGEPVHRIIGSRSFYGLDFKLNRATLEPRPDTECLVDAVLDFVKANHGLDARLKFADIGTGTGAIAIALLSLFQNATAVLTDLSPEALQAAEENAKIHALLDRVELRQGSYLEPLVGDEGCFDFITSNPPYIVSAEIEKLDVEVQSHDPRLALDGGEDGLIAYRELLPNCGKFLKPNGAVFLEFGYDQAQAILEIANDAQNRDQWHSPKIHRDLGENDRLISAIKV